jgi:hypothetical protein
MKTFLEHIVKTDSGYKLVSKSSGKNLGTASSLSGIKKREAQVQYFKHMKEDGMGAGAVGAPANNVGGGNIAGSGGAGGEPGVSKKRNPVMSFFKRKQPKM